ncbi:MAG TPA: glycerophosphodiester phosphodiesterase [Candidatus Sulfotelmatobacter sp.]|nr:glycerophosphodiester phosphodiesterase [Candidatus Sulfotelmatobacter sp.]
MQWIGHAGLAANKHRGIPTAETLQLACRLHLDWLELDVWPSADGALVLSHARRIAGGAAIPSTSLAALQELLPTLLTLDDAADICRGKVRLLIDVKTHASAAPLAAWLERTRTPQDFAVCTESATFLSAIQAHAPAVGLWLTLPEVAPGRWEWLRRVPAVARRRSLPRRLEVAIERLDISVITVDHLALTPALCEEAHRLDLQVAAWTLNYPWLARRAARAGADLITTDSVGAMREVVATPARQPERRPRLEELIG